MIQRLEIYAIAIGAGLLLLVLGTTGGYFKGRLDEKAAITQKQLADDAKKMTDYQGTLEKRAAADDTARDKALAFVADIDKRMDGINAKFAKLPNVVVDARGCERLTDAARLRWNSVELLPTGNVDATSPIQPGGGETPRPQ
ncbi:MAG TPA: hypothetical protein VNN25_06500 [Thermoanaerobaculia bacterium]|nr:hypothetical protein [Thermoanaerobaculia bacterium]